MPDIKVGHIVTTSADKDEYNGDCLSDDKVRNTALRVSSIDNDVAVLSNNKGERLASVSKDSLTRVNAGNTVTKSNMQQADKAVAQSQAQAQKVANTTATQQAQSSQSTGTGTDLGDWNAYLSSSDEELLKYNMRLFGLPYQFTPYCDYRTYSTSNKNKISLVGRKFLENVMLEAPVVTIIPGQPLYLPSAKNKQSVSQGLLSAANGNLSVLFQALSNEGNINEKLRYYDFKQDYYTYMKYVNIMCQVAAAFLDLEDRDIDGIPLTAYDWKNYRWNNSAYKTSVANITAAAGDGFVDGLKALGSRAVNAIDNLLHSETQDKKVNAFVDTGDKSFMESLEDVLTQVNFVQFYVDSSSGASETASNRTTQSKLQGIFDSADEFLKEISFIVNSGGTDLEKFGQYAAEGGAAMLQSLNNSFSQGGGITGFFDRFLSSAKNVLVGETMIFPEIYQRSDFEKSYNIIVNLNAVYGNKMSYYIDLLVPLFHMLCLAIPKQTTANTHGSPFLIKAYYPGSFSCNLGIVSSITIDKSGGSYTADGLPTSIKVTLSIVDLYSDLSMTPTGDVILFLANSSLIEYIATSCGVNLTTPQLINRAKYFTTVIKSAINSVPEEIAMTLFGGLEDVIAGLTGV